MTSGLLIRWCQWTDRKSLELQGRNAYNKQERHHSTLQSPSPLFKLRNVYQKPTVDPRDIHNPYHLTHTH